MAGSDQPNRRKFLRTASMAGAAVAVPLASGYVGYRLPRSEEAPPAPPAAPASKGSDVEAFVSRPDLRPPRLRVTRDRSATPTLAEGPSYLTVAPKNYQEKGAGQPGCLLTDLRGEPVWFLPLPGDGQVPFDFRVQSYRGEPVLTWWQGTVLTGYGHGVGLIYDSSYRKVAEVRAGNGVEVDLHEFLITDRDTAVILAYPVVEADLRAVGGPERGWVFDGVVQEVDIASGDVLFEWRATDHVRIEESHKKLADTGTKDKPFDYFHINSAGFDPNGDVVISARNTWAVYLVAREGGKVRWRLGGKRSDFELGQRERFYWQHDARLYADGMLSLFDNAASPPQADKSRGMILRLNEEAGTATLEQELRHPARLRGDNQGGMQLLPDGRALVCWGAQPFVTEFDRNGNMILDVRFPSPKQTYRAYTADWVGEPAERPAVAFGPNQAGGATLYVSWNGATEVRRWRILAGPDRNALEPVATVPRSGFETAAVVKDEAALFAAVALDADGTELGRSEPVPHRS